ncbi:hypothetical protein P692DRAFT_201725674, partial [Suillus brevipes Sb2]
MVNHPPTTGKGHSPAGGQRRPPKEVPPAETGRPETAAEFARRVAGSFVLRGPRERKEGEDPGGKSTKPSVSTSTEESPPPEEAETDSPAPPPWYPEQDELIAGMRNRYQEDPFFKRIIDSPSSYRNFEEASGLLRIRLKDRTLLCVPDLRIDGRSVREIIISQAHSLLAHLGAQKTLTYLRDHVWWKS